MHDSINNLNWLNWINKYHDKSIHLTLERINLIAEALQITNFNIPVITVAGTNGKGSTVATLEAILLASGKKVGAYTSPHFFRFVERIRINGQIVKEDLCATAFNEIYYYISPLFPEEFANLTFFEYATLIALKIFQQANLDIIILEVGLGGRLDAVNVVNNNLSIITSIGLDHTEYLGDTLAKIAAEKAGIIKPNSYFICGEANPPESLITIAHKNKAKAFFINQDFKVVYDQANQHNWDYLANNFKLTNLPINSFPAENMACAIQALSCLNLLPHMFDHTVLNNIKIPGRFQQLVTTNGTEVILDVAHNPPAAVWLAKKIQQLPYRKNLIAIFGIATNKNYLGVITPLLKLVNIWYPIDLSLPTNNKTPTRYFFAADNLIQAIQKLGGKAARISSIQQYLLNRNADDRVLVFGSFVTIAKVFQELGVNLC